MKKINGGFSIVKNDQFMGPSSVGERFNDEQDNLPTKSNRRQIKKPHKEELGLEQNMETQEKRLLDNNQGSYYPQWERRPSIRLKDHLTFSAIKTSDVKEPFNVSKTLHHMGWKDALEEEMESIRKNKTWILIDLHKGKSPIIANWVFKTKMGNT